ncbi:transglutaminase-like domain-containing protein [Persicobacter diffluens]|uniref:Transglutaminase-like domain-containing protein n=1 Tax=Persicobacter diffluens TaxID=981 RepID=A0AAN5ALA6_9BACT|nr:hypothetical protein PEDI_36060 [Persicobacter diffluens]
MNDFFSATLRSWVFLLLISVACRQSVDQQVPQKYQEEISQALSLAGENATELELALTKVPAAQKEGMAYLIAYMPERDLKSLKADYLLENTALAYQAREEFAWAKAIPKEVFFNEVLPYATLNERRDNWRQDFYNRFAPMVKDAGDIREAIHSINHAIMEEVKVKYSTARPKPDQSPYESMDCGLASCTGLSVLLVDAFRAVGIPARIVGTPNWTTKEGNHNWNEVYVDGQWNFTEYYPSDGLDKGWFLPDAGQANPASKAHWIYASSYKPADAHFPLVWDEDIKYVHAENVTQRYLDLYQAHLQEEAAMQDGKVKVQLVMFKNQACSMGDDRVAAEVKILKDGEVLLEGKTASPEQDMNDFLTFYVEAGSEIKLVYPTKAELAKQETKMVNESQTIRLYYQ